jgi:cytochrome c-type biogenesis protein CcmE
MHPLRKRRLYGGLSLLVLLGCVVLLVLYGMRQNISLFYTPTQVKLGQAPLGSLIRVGGMVMKKSVHHETSSLRLHFDITDFKHHLVVQYEGVLPDLFREGQGVVVSGRLQNQQLMIATEVLAKHDAAYMPPELRHLVKQDDNRHVG